MEPRPAATVVVARPGHEGVEVLVLRRSRTSRFAPGFVVFPGGVVEPGDDELAARWFGDAADAPRACAVRELHEETGLLLTPDGLRPAPDASLGRDAAPPGRDALVELGRWVAPAFLEVRFDARFYAVAAPGGLEARADGVEIEAAWWAPPPAVLDLSRRGDAPLMWPTLVMLERLATCASVEAVLALRVPQVDPPVSAPGPGGGPRAFRPGGAAS